MFNLKFDEMNQRLNYQYANNKDDIFELNGVYELTFAKFLNSKNICWVKNDIIFKLEHGTYKPDFYLPELDLWIEIKGRNCGAYVRHFSKKIRDFSIINKIITFYFRSKKGQFRTEDYINQWFSENVCTK